MTKSIPHIDLWPVNKGVERAFFSDLKAWYRAGAFSGGTYVERFENEFAAYLQTPHCVGVNSGTSALHLALLALGIGPGDEVVVPAYTFAGTVWGVLYCGAKPVFADVEVETGNLSVAAVEKAIGPRTRAVIAVHLFGQAADLAGLKSVLRKRKIPLIEDAAQAHGGRSAGRALGTIGDIGCFSFYPTKNMGACGEGGAVVTAKKAWADRIRLLRNHNCIKRYEHLGVGFNYRMEGIQGLFLSHKLKDLDRCNAERAAIAAAYLKAIDTGNAIKPLGKPGPDSAWHAFVLRVVNRKDFLRRLDEEKIGYAIYYPKILPELPAFKNFTRGSQKFPNAAELSRTSVSLPLYPGLAKRDVARVADVLKAW